MRMENPSIVNLVRVGLKLQNISVVHAVIIDYGVVIDHGIVGKNLHNDF